MNISRILPPPLSTDAVEAPVPSVHDAFKRAVAALVRCCATGTADPRQRYLSRSVNHEDLENRIRAWEAYEARLRCLPPVL
ncbi:hypothetical protein VAPA_2c10320 [Variovorax paradoxus B4]|uniref:Uncharacterized protein n=1 Tax=Variovorax paradoxus B4 TaxID=1246301 RepID=T1XLX8_VARPD|nr:hypothetical protein [Variovorax paradoxus]AGU53588.1 hypothetical protein VAPA_2c10320 [Variovorax paradoxus B4]